MGLEVVRRGGLGCSAGQGGEMLAAREGGYKASATISGARTGARDHAP
jgi:hypothetical protein